jgi:hypothetical protein
MQEVALRKQTYSVLCGLAGYIYLPNCCFPMQSTLKVENPKIDIKIWKDEACESLKKYRHAHLLWFDTPKFECLWCSLCKRSRQYFSVEFWRKHFLKILAKKLEAFTKNLFYKTIDINDKLLRSHNT